MVGAMPQFSKLYARTTPVMCLLLQLMAACESDDPTPDAAAPDDSEHAVAKSAKEEKSSAFGEDADVYAWRTDEFELDPGQEQYLCFASTLGEDMVVNGFSSEVKPFVHHLIFSKARAPEKEGFEECNVSFRNSWEVLFLSGAGNSTLDFPEDAGSVLPAGTQLVVQMHLLNTSDKAVSGSTLINMRRSAVKDPRRVSSAVFGTAAVALPSSSPAYQASRTEDT